MRKILILVAALATLLAVSAVPAAAAPRNANSVPFELNCDDDGTITVFAIFNSSGAALFVEESNGREYLMSWYKLTDVEDPEFFFEKYYGQRNGFDPPIYCELDEPVYDPAFGIWYTVETLLVSK